MRQQSSRAFSCSHRGSLSHSTMSIYNQKYSYMLDYGHQCVYNKVVLVSTHWR